MDREIAVEARLAIERGTPVGGICLYPIVDRPTGRISIIGTTAAYGMSRKKTGYVKEFYAKNTRAILGARKARCVLLNSHLNETIMKLPILVFSHLRWDFVYQRPQHLMSRLKRNRCIIFFEEPFYTEEPAAFLCRGAPLENVLVLKPHTPLKVPGFHDEQLP